MLESHVGNRTSFLCQCWPFSQILFTQLFVQATFKSSKLSELLVLFRNPKTCSRLPQILELLPTSFNNICLNLKNVFPPLEKSLVDLPPFVWEGSLTLLPQRPFDELRTNGHRIQQGRNVFHNHSGHFHEWQRMGILDSSQSRGVCSSSGPSWSAHFPGSWTCRRHFQTLPKHLVCIFG